MAQALEALEFAHGAILDAIGMDDGLDSAAGEEVVHMIRAALTANGRTPPDWPTEDAAVLALPIRTTLAAVTAQRAAPQQTFAIAQRIRAEMRKAEHYVRPESGVVRFMIPLTDLNALLRSVLYVDPVDAKREVTSTALGELDRLLKECSEDRATVEWLHEALAALQSLRAASPEQAPS